MTDATVTEANEPVVAPARPLFEAERPPTSAPLPSPNRRFLGPSTRAWFVHVAVGGDRPIRNNEYGFAELGSLHLEQAIGGHVGGGDGFAVAIVTQQTLATDAYTYVFAGRFQYDIPVHRELGVYITPMLTFGYRRIREGGIDAGCPPDSLSCTNDLFHQATIQVAVGLTFVIADRLPLFVRPIGLDIGAPHMDDDAVPLSLRWHVVGGFGVSF